jgi:uncharacterized membrane protein YjfL (UPF0719 family)
MKLLNDVESESDKKYEKQYMEKDFLYVTIFNLSVNMVYAALSVVVGVAALVFIDRKLFKKLDFQEEIKNGNIAAAILASTILIFIAIVMSFGLK